MSSNNGARIARYTGLVAYHVLALMSICAWLMAIVALAYAKMAMTMCRPASTNFVLEGGLVIGAMAAAAIYWWAAKRRGFAAKAIVLAILIGADVLVVGVAAFLFVVFGLSVLACA
jgi:hypothetical protein